MANRLFSMRVQVLLVHILPFFAVHTTLAQGEASADILKYIDPLIGTINGGHVFPGASLAFGMAKAVANTNGGGGQGGYASDDSDSE